MTVRTIAKVADAFKVNREVAPTFRKDVAQPYDERILRFVKDGAAASIWTLEGRITVPCVMGEHQRRLFAFQKGEVDLCFVAASGIWPQLATSPRRPSSTPKTGLALISVSFPWPSIAMAQPTPAQTLSAFASVSLDVVKAFRSAARKRPSVGCANSPASKRGSRNIQTT